MPVLRPVEFFAGDFSTLRYRPDECSSASNYGSKGQFRTHNVVFDDSPHTVVVWQADVYNYARNVANEINARRIVDLGCGNALKLRAITEGTEVEVIAVDYQRSLASARENIPYATFYECNLADWNDVFNVCGLIVTSDAPSVVIASDVIEHLTDPRPFLVLLRRVLASNPENRLILSTPDRSRLNYARNEAIPANSAHIREWTLLELCGLLGAAGLSVIKAGHVHPNKFDSALSTIIADVSYNAADHVRYLAQLGIRTATEPVDILVTTEYPGANHSGGIGAFVANQRKQYENSIVLLYDPIEPSSFDPWPTGIFHPSQIVKRSALKPPEDLLFEATEHLLFLLPNVRSVQYQDYRGIGCRISQAKRAGILPETLCTVVHCHGSSFYLENANECWQDFGANTPEKEKISIEAADLVVFPTKFLRDLYAESGIKPAPEKIRLIPYFYEVVPIDLKPAEAVTDIVFIGKRIPMKGFDLFVEAVSQGIVELQSAGVKKIVAVGKRIDKAMDHRLDELRPHFTVVEHEDFDWHTLRSFILEASPRALFILPYRADNYPIAILDVVSAGGVAVSTNTGGIPEIFSSPVWREGLADPTSAALFRRIMESVAKSPSERDFIRRTLLAEVRAQVPTPINFPTESLETNANLEGLASVVIPYFNTPLQYVEDLVNALNNQSLPPAEVIIVDDASQREMALQLESAATKLSAPHRIIRHEVNKGLAGARNTALAACKTPYLLNIDSDDIPLNDWVRDIVVALNRNPDAGAAVPYLRAFNDGDDFRSGLGLAGYTYRPLGDGAIAAQTENILGHANSGVRVAMARNVGGWGEHTKAKFEDWAFYLALKSRGHGISIIPRVACLYRVRIHSMLRTYSDWPGLRRIASITRSLSLFDAFRLQNRLRTGMQRGADLENQVADLKNQVTDLQNQIAGLRAEARSELDRYRAQARSELDRYRAQARSEIDQYRKRKVVRIADAVRRRSQGFPLVWWIFSKMAATIWRTGRAIRRMLTCL
ncbi:glycosyltransferase [Bradyrhizobium sp. STM 3562]|uniref:glycosyltransferase n=1 Tax=Bradyrhizobium sp. STM 3562 TaxID=578924 RepID=UPI00388F2352